MRWAWRERRRAEERALAAVEERLEHEAVVDEHVEQVVSRMEDIQRRNHFGDSLAEAFRRKRGWA